MGALGDEPNPPSRSPRREAWITELTATTEQLAGDGREIGLLRELAEAEVAATNSHLHAYMQSQETSNAARERDGEYAAMEYRNEATRLKARVDAARVRHTALITLLSLP